jgi:hypothetical protein
MRAPGASGVWEAFESSSLHREAVQHAMGGLVVTDPGQLVAGGIVVAEVPAAA